MRGADLALFNTTSTKPEIPRLVSEQEYPYRPDVNLLNTMTDRRIEHMQRLQKAYVDSSLAIAIDDEMWNGLRTNDKIDNSYHRQHYMYGGRCALKLMINALVAADVPAPNAILDFPSGHGRVMRFLHTAFPNAELFAGDTNESGIAFCQQQWGAKPILSKPDLREVQFDRKFDLIWCGSLATHLDSAKVIDLLDLLTNALSADGILGITTCGRGAIWTQNNMFSFIEGDRFDRAMKQYAISGLGYVDYSWTQAYGMTWIHPHWMVNYIAGRDDLTVLSFSEKGWHGAQDVWFIIKRPLSHWYDFNRD